MANILVVDDDRNIRRMLATALEGAGHNVAEAAGAAQALSRLAAAPAVELVLTDVRMEKTDGIALLEQIKQLRPALPVIIMTAFGSIPAAVEAMRLGAYDYVPKPFSAQQIRQTVARALEIQSLRQENRALKSRLERLSAREQFLASSAHTIALMDVAAQVAASDATVLLTGESGTGKNLLARHIHQLSPRKNGPFVSVASPRSASICWKASYLVTSAAPSPAPSRTNPDGWRRPRAARSFSMRSAICRWGCKPSSCAFYRRRTLSA